MPFFDLCWEGNFHMGHFCPLTFLVNFWSRKTCHTKGKKSPVASEIFSKDTGIARLKNMGRKGTSQKKQVTKRQNRMGHFLPPYLLFQKVPLKHLFVLYNGQKPCKMKMMMLYKKVYSCSICAVRQRQASLYAIGIPICKDRAPSIKNALRAFFGRPKAVVSFHVLR